MATHYVNKITKEGSDILIYVTCDNGEKPIKINCVNKGITSYTGRKVRSFPNNVSYAGGRTGTRRALNIILDWLDWWGDYTNDFKKLEPFLSNTDLLDANYCLPTSCPKGYIKWLRENNKLASHITLAEYNMRRLENNMGEDIKKFALSLSSFSNAHYGHEILDWLINEKDMALRKKFCQILKTTYKEICWNLYDEVSKWFNFFITGHEKIEEAFGKNWIDLLDGNRNFEYNVKIFSTMLEERKNKKLLDNEAKIKSIENLSTEKFTIIVPSAMEQFSEEGRMQNNCVGYFYHDTIREGINLIYFIRRAENPTHSYLTNRYNVEKHKTTETRMFNNRENTDLESLKLISKIDEMITEILAA